VSLGLRPLSGVSIGRLSGVVTLWDCVPRVCGGGGGCAGSDLPVGAVPALSGVGRCLSGVYISSSLFFKYSFRIQVGGGARRCT